MKQFILVTILLTMIAAFFVTGTVKGQNNGDNNEKDAYYDQVEREYLILLKEELKEEGFSNCGITMTKVIFEDGNREYTVLINHKSIKKLSSNEKQELISSLSVAKFSSDKIKFLHEFL